MGVSIKIRKNQDGSQTPLLDVYYKGSRVYEFLWFLKLWPEITKHDKRANEERMMIVKMIQANIAIHLTCMEYDIEYSGIKYKPKVSVVFPKFPIELINKYPELVSLKQLLLKIKNNLKNDNRSNLLK